jgi:hypothetical protein
MSTSGLLYAMHHRRRQAHAIWPPTWAPPLRSCPLGTAADWGRVPRPCPGDDSSAAPGGDVWVGRLRPAS